MNCPICKSELSIEVVTDFGDCACKYYCSNAKCDYATDYKRPAELMAELRCWQRAAEIYIKAVNELDRSGEHILDSTNNTIIRSINLLTFKEAFALAYAIAEAEQDGVVVLEGGTE